ncbi:MAG: hypothetical protein F6K30_23800 [Cyanothece sp. SIO2G6]|nr:hypothetical protein [Cyanothece sp. SIO2G6]
MPTAWALYLNFRTGLLAFSAGTGFLPIGLTVFAQPVLRTFTDSRLHTRLPRRNPRDACASRKKRQQIDGRLEFSKVTAFDA